MVTKDISVAGGMDQSDDAVSSASEESNGDALLGFGIPRSVELNTPPMQEVDTNMVTKDINVARGMDQSDYVVSSASEESNGNAPLDLSMPRFVESTAPPVQEVDVELIGQTRVSPIFTSVIMANPNRLARHEESMDVFMEDADDVVPYPSGHSHSYGWTWGSWTGWVLLSKLCSLGKICGV